MKYVLPFLLAISVFACSPIEQEIKPSVPGYLFKHRELQPEIYGEDYQVPDEIFGLNNFEGKNAALMDVVNLTNSEELPDVFENAKILDSIELTNLFGNLQPYKTVSEKLKDEQGAYESSAIDTMLLIKLLDKEFSHVLKYEYDLDYLILPAIDFYPCDLCTNRIYLQLSLLVIELESGYPVWWGVDWEFVQYDNPELEQRAADMGDRILLSFRLDNYPSHHRQRFLDLKTYASRKR